MADAVVIGRAAAKQNKQAMRWQQECVEISRKKAKKRWRHDFRRRLKLGVALMSVASIALTGYWVWHSGQVDRAYNGTKDWLYGLTSGAGFEVATIKIDGLSKMPVEYVVQAMGAEVGDPILRVSLKEVKGQLEALPEIRRASVERQLPDTLYVEIVERSGAALWQNKGSYQLIDVDGTVLSNQERDPKKRYIVLAGADVPQVAEDFLAMLHAEPELHKQVEAATRVGERRWDVRLKNGVTVKLPQDKPIEAWKKLGGLVRNQQLLDRSVQVIDMRIDDRLFLTLEPSAEETQKQIMTSARDI